MVCGTHLLPPRFVISREQNSLIPPKKAKRHITDSKSAIKAELNLFKYRLVPKMKRTLPIIQNICTIGQLKIRRQEAIFNW